MTGKISKRTIFGALLSIVLIVCMALGIYFLIPSSAVAYADDDANDHTHTTGTWDTYVGTGGELSGGNYYLTTTITLTSSISIRGDVTLCLNNRTINGFSGSAIAVNSGATLTLCDCGGSGRITGTDTSGNGAAIYVYSGTLNMYGGTITGNTTSNNGGGVFADQYSYFYMYGGTITGNTARNGGGVFVTNSSRIRAYGGEITNNTATNEGGGIYVFYSYSNILSGSAVLSGNTTSGNGDEAYVYSNSSDSLYVRGGFIDGAVHSDGGHLEITDGYLSATALETASTYINEGYEAFRTDEYTDYPYHVGESHSHSDATYVYPVDSHTITSTGGALVGGNSEEEMVYFHLTEDVTANLTITGCATLCLNGHTLTGEGDTSVIVVDENSVFNLYDCEGGGQITGGSARRTISTDDENGGGIIVGSYSTFNMYGGTITGNQAYYGSGVYMCSNTTFNMNGGTISGNLSAWMGTGILSHGNVYIYDGFLGDGISTSTVQEMLLYGGYYASSLSSLSTYLAEGYSMIYTNGYADFPYVVISGHTHEETVYTVLTSSTTTLSGGSSENEMAYYYLGSDTTMSGAISISGYVTLCLNGHVLAGSGSDSVINLTSANFYLYDCMEGDDSVANEIDGTVYNSGVITGGNSSRRGGGIYVQSSSTFNMYAGAIAGNYAGTTGGGVFVMSTSTFNMYNGTISDNTANTNGGGLYVSGTFNMYNGTISDNTANSNGGGLYLDRTFIMSSGTISGNIASANGGGVYAVNTNYTVTFTVTDSAVISGNEAAAGGGVYIGSNVTLNMSGGTISENTTDGNGNGGGVYVESGATLNLTESAVISGNEASENGGGVYVAGTFTMNSGSILENTATYGAGVYVGSTGTLTLNNGEISSNTASNRGGAVYAYGTFYMYDGTLYNNYGYQTYAVSINGGTFTMWGGTITGSRGSGSDQSVVYSQNSGYLNIYGGTIDGPNRSLFAYESTLLIAGGTMNGEVRVTRTNAYFTMTGGHLAGVVSIWTGATVSIQGGYLSASAYSTLEQYIAEGYAAVDLSLYESPEEIYSGYSTSWPWAVYPESSYTYTINTISATWSNGYTVEIFQSADSYDMIFAAYEYSNSEASGTGLPADYGQWEVSTVWIVAVIDGTHYAYVTPVNFVIHISALTLTEADVDIEYSDVLVYNGQEQEVAVSAVYVNGILIDPTLWVISSGSGAVYRATDAGDYQFLLTVTSSFVSGTTYVPWSIATRDIEDAVITPGDALTYNGQEQTQDIASVIVSVGGDNLVVTYDVTGNTGTDADTYTLTIIGTGNFSGTKTYEWTIATRDIGDAAITFGDSLTYNAQEQTVTISSVTVNNGTLTVTYEVLDSSDTGTNADTYTLTISGTGNFSGTATTQWTIAALSISSASVVFGTLTYNGQQQDVEITSITVGGIAVDGYSLSGSTYGTDADSYEVTITGTGNFSGSITKMWVIDQKALESGMFTIGAVIYTGSQIAPAVGDAGFVFNDSNGNLTASDFEITDYGTNVQAGTGAGIIYISGLNNYTGSITVYFDIVQAELTSGMFVIIGEYTYTGSAINAEFDIADSMANALTWDDFTYEYRDNTAAGTAYILITATQDSSWDGSAYVYFNIARRDISDAVITLQQDEFDFSGTLRVPEIDSVSLTFTVGSESVTLYLTGADYYTTGDTSATNASTYQLYIVGQTNFSGTAYVSWVINAIDITAGTFGDPVVTLGDTLYYNGTVQMQTVISVMYGSYSINFSVSDNTAINAGEYWLTITATGDFTGTIRHQWRLYERDIESADVQLGDSLTYNGQEQTQTITSVTITIIRDNTYVTLTLVEGTDYTVEGATQTDAETYTMTITGINNYDGTITRQWTIATRDIEGAEITLGDSLTYNAQEQTQDIASVTLNITINGVAATLILTEGTDFTVEGNTGEDATTYTLYVYGQGNYSGSESIQWTIATLNINGADFVFGEVTYNGNVQNVVIVSVTKDGVDVYEGGYNIISGGTGDNASWYNIFIQGTGNFTGTANAQWFLSPLNIADATIELGDSLTYNGQEQTQTIVSVKINGLDVTYMVGGDTETGAGNYTLTVWGTDNFTGSATQEWTLYALNIGEAEFELGEVTYNGREQEVEIISITVNGIVVDTYTVTSGGSATDADTYTLVVEGTDNFTGTASTEWTLNRRDIAGAEIVLAAYNFNYDGLLKVATITGVTLTITAGSEDIVLILALYTDYDIVSGNSAVSASDYTLWISGQGNFTGLASVDWAVDPIDITLEEYPLEVTLGGTLTYNGDTQTQTVASVMYGSHNVTISLSNNTAINVGNYWLTITATGNFTGTVQYPWTLYARDIAEVEVTLGDSLTYNGQEQTQTLTSVTLTVWRDNTEFTLYLTEYNEDNGGDYTISGHIQTNADTYTLVLTGVGNYNGTLEVQWTLNRRSVEGAQIVLGDSLTYNGQDQTQTVSSVTLAIMIGEEFVTLDLVEGTDFYLTNNTGEDATTYTLYVVGMGNYNDLQSATWTIAQLNISGADFEFGEVIYNGNVQNVEIISITKDGVIVYEGGYTIESGESATNADWYTITVSGLGNFSGTATAQWRLSALDIDGAEIVLGDSLTYNGQEQTQTIVSVTKNGLDVTYTVSGDAETDADTYTLTVTGTGNFTGTATQEWTLNRLDIDGAEFELGSLTYNGSEQTLTIISVTKNGLEVTFDVVSGNTGTNADTYTLVVEGTDNFTGTASTEWTLNRRDIADAEIELSFTSIDYNGAQVIIEVESITVTVDIDGEQVTLTLYEGTDYVIEEYTDRGVNASTYEIVLNGVDNYTGSAGKEWVINALDISNAVITLGDSLTYNGQSQTQTITGITLYMYGTHDVTYAVYGSSNVGTDAGTYTLTVTGTGNFTGTATIEWTIAALDISNATIVFGELTYNGEEQAAPIVSVTVNGIVVDTYDIVSGGTGTEADTYTLTISGTGNFTGTASGTWGIAEGAGESHAVEITFIVIGALAIVGVLAAIIIIKKRRS